MLGDTGEKIVLDWRYVGVGISEEEETEFTRKMLEKATASVSSGIASVRLLYTLRKGQI